jgi:hypothetical protein
LADSIDYPVKYKVAFNNGEPGALQQFEETHKDWIVKDSPVGNRGVAGSWNDCAKWFSSEPCWLLMNEDAYFLPGHLENICLCADQYPSAPVIYLNESMAYYCFVWTQFGRNAIGEFDENLWPAYYEDCDYRVRMRLLNLQSSCALALADLPPLPHGKPFSGGTDYAAMLQGCGLLNRAYWLKKWGSFNYENAAYFSPYRDQRLTPRDTVYDPVHRAKLYPLWETFMAMPGRSIYT